MEQKEKVCLDKLKLVKLLEAIGSAVENKKKTKKNILDIEKALDDLITCGNINKEQLITKWIQISGEQAYNNLLVTNIRKYFEKLSVVLQGGAIYLNKTGDPLYLVAELVILTDWYLYRKINLQDV